MALMNDVIPRKLESSVTFRHGGLAVLCANPFFELENTEHFRFAEKRDARTSSCHNAREKKRPLP